MEMRVIPPQSVLVCRGDVTHAGAGDSDSIPFVLFQERS